jgi:hypothetical protein
MLSGRTLPRVARSEHGFTLMETLVAMLSAVVVTGATFVILEVALHQTARIADVAQATQLGRTAMTNIVDKLHSVCLAPQFTPVEQGSTEKSLIFVGAYGKEAELGSAHKEKIEWTGTSSTPGNLVDYYYPSNGGSWPSFTFAATPTPAGGTRIAEKVSQTETEAKAKVPVFQYYKYSSKVSSGAENNPLGALEQVIPPAEGLSAANAETVASVLVSFRAAPPSGLEALHRTVDLSNQVTFAFSAPDPEETLKDAPCQ